jgi:iron complex outermembrane recepter protein
VQASWSYQSAGRPFLTSAEFVGSGSQNLKGFSSFDFSTGADIGGFSVELFVQNAFDKRGILSLNSACGLTQCLAAARAFPIKPQQFGLKIGTKF